MCACTLFFSLFSSYTISIICFSNLYTTRKCRQRHTIQCSKLERCYARYWMQTILKLLWDGRIVFYTLDFLSSLGKSIRAESKIYSNARDTHTIEVRTSIRNRTVYDSIDAQTYSNSYCRSDLYVCVLCIHLQTMLSIKREYKCNSCINVLYGTYIHINISIIWRSSSCNYCC